MIITRVLPFDGFLTGFNHSYAIPWDWLFNPVSWLLLLLLLFVSEADGDDDEPDDEFIGVIFVCVSFNWSEFVSVHDLFVFDEFDDEQVFASKFNDEVGLEL